jgi:regulator of sigma E protease
MHLIGVTWNLQLLVVILEVAFGLGMVIFVHELGHFLVAKWCGVKCEKFYLGFDIYGLKLAKFQWGETEYGIGILPLGGYVKMLGQDDNPSRAAQERERSTLHVPSGDLPPEPTTGPHGEQPAHLDPRSYMAKSVPQRMAIISAGVIMNVIFAFLMASLAYGIGVRDLACGVSALVPGEAAWRADMRPGDRILAINEETDHPVRFRDLMNAVALCDINKGIDFLVQREGVDKPFWVNVKPDPDIKRLRPTIGVVQPRTAKLSDTKATISGTPAAKTGKFEPGDRIVGINDRHIKGYADLVAALAQLPDKTLSFTVERDKPKSADSKTEHAEHIHIEVAPRPMRTLGLVMKMGKITAVQKDSPAEAAGIEPGDFITSIDGQEPGDPLRLPDVLRRRAGQTITLDIARESRAGEDEKIQKQITLREPRWSDDTDGILILPGTPVSVPALGIAYKVLNIVHQTDKDGPAAAAKLTKDGQPADVPLFAQGNEIVKAAFEIPKPDATQKSDDKLDMSDAQPVEFGEETPNWPFFMAQVQWLPPGSKVTLTLNDGRTTTIEPVDAADWYFADRGLVCDSEFVNVRASSVGQAFALGGRETVDAVLSVYRFIRKIGTQISPFLLGGPKTIAAAAGSAAYDSFSQLLIFLTLLSANLAVVNFLPIPLLDGGHMVFLILEGILRRPVSERIVVAFHYAGFVFIISLMLFVLGLDFNVIPRM